MASPSMISKHEDDDRFRMQEEETDEVVGESKSASSMNDDSPTNITTTTDVNNDVHGNDDHHDQNSSNSKTTNNNNNNNNNNRSNDDTPRSPTMLEWIEELHLSSTDEILEKAPCGSPFEFAWAAHRLLEDSVQHGDHNNNNRNNNNNNNSSGGDHDNNDTTTTNTNTSMALDDDQQVSCLLLLEKITQLDSPSSKSPFYAVLAHHALMTLFRGNQKAMDLLDRILPQVLGGIYYSLSADGALNDRDHIELEKQLKQWIGRHLDTTSVSPLLWMKTSKETAELERLLEKTMPLPSSSIDYESLLTPLPPVELPFSRPLPPPLLPSLGYDEDDVIEQLLVDSEQEQDLFEYLHAELQWLTPTNLRLMLLPEDEDSKSIQQLLSRAFQAPLTPKEQRQLVDNLSEQIIQQSELSQQTLASLVEHNPHVAYECLVLSKLQNNDYLSALVTMDMSLHSMEVVNRLATRTEEPLLHPEYIHLYINHCIASCETIPNRNTQNRLVRLVCIFLQSLILRNQILQVKDIYYELEAFCIEFSRIREANALFKLLKSMQ